MERYYSQSWGNWDVRCLNAVMKVPQLAEVRILPYDRRSRQIMDEMRWESVVELGWHSLNGTYSDILLRAYGANFRLEFGSDGDMFTYKISPVCPTPQLCFLIAGLFRWNAPGKVERLLSGKVNSDTKRSSG